MVFSSGSCSRSRYRARANRAFESYIGVIGIIRTHACIDESREGDFRSRVSFGSLARSLARSQPSGVDEEINVAALPGGVGGWRGGRGKVTLPERNIIRSVIPTCSVLRGEAAQEPRLLIIRPANTAHCYRLGQQSAAPPRHIDAILPRSCIMNGWLMTLRSLRKPLREDDGG